MAPLQFSGFSREQVQVPGGSVFLRLAGSGPAVLLLHGYPETHLAWRKVAPLLAGHYSVIAADLPGYGDSILSDEERERLTKREMAQILVDAMAELGISRLTLVGHDRGARVAYRLALDHPERVSALAVLDVVPILDVADRLTYATARQMAHWFWLAQPSKVPATLIGLAPELYLRHIIEAWGGSGVIEPEAVVEYLRCMRKPEVLRAISLEYQADEEDLEHDRADRTARHRIGCPLLVLWTQNGFAEQFGDPIEIWRGWADRVTGEAMPGGHFMMEESPERVGRALVSFLSSITTG